MMHKHLLGLENYPAEDIQKVLVSQDGLFARLHNVEHGVTGCLLHLDLLILKALGDWRQDLVEVLDMPPVVEGHRNGGKAVESRSASARIVSLLTMVLILRYIDHLGEHLNSLINLIKLIIRKQLFN